MSKDCSIELLDPRNRPADEAINLLDMSGCGLGIECRQPLIIGQTLGFKMKVGSDRPLNAKARVRWTRPIGYHNICGLELEDMGFFERQRLLRWIDPARIGLEEAGNLLLQGAATLMAIYVVGDWVRSSPAALSTLKFCVPYFAAVFALAYTVWKFPRES